jgi:putative DNA primase/helicase
MIGKDEVWPYDLEGSPPGIPIGRRIFGRQLLEDGEIRKDLANGKRLKLIYGDDLRYCHQRKKWLIFDGAKWTWDEDGRALRMAMRVVYETFRQAANVDDPVTKKSAWEAMTHRALKEMLAVGQSDLAINIEMLDRHPDLIVFKDGTVNLRTCEVGPHKREHFITKMINFNYVPEGCYAPTFQAFLSRALGWHAAMSGEEAERLRQMNDAIQQYFGYSLTGLTSSKAVFVWHGPSDTGKSTLLDTFRELLGDYACKIQIESLMRGAENSSNAQSDLADLHGRRFAMTSEIGQGQRLSVHRLKSITQGGGKIKAARKYENVIEFEETHKLHCDSNFLPTVPDDDDALWNRIVPVPLNVVIPKSEQDQALRAKLLAEAEGILAWAVRGAKRWYDCGGKLDRPQAVLDAGAQYRNRMSQVHQFFDDCCERGAGYSVGSTRLYQAYERWANSRRLRVMSHKGFSQEIKAHGANIEYPRSGALVIGVKLVSFGVEDVED